MGYIIDNTHLDWLKYSINLQGPQGPQGPQGTPCSSLQTTREYLYTYYDISSVVISTLNTTIELSFNIIDQLGFTTSNNIDFVYTGSTKKFILQFISTLGANPPFPSGSTTAVYVNFYINNIIVPSGNSVSFSSYLNSLDAQRLNLGTNAILTLNPGDSIFVGVLTTAYAVLFRKIATVVPYILTIHPI
jgi:hypothetical protein